MILRLICLVTLLITGWGEKNVNHKKMEPVDFYIKITRKVFGRPATITIVQSDRLEVQLFTPRAITPGEVKERRLTPEETQAMSEFMKTFPLEDLKEHYIYGGVKDGTELHFLIRVDQFEKNIFIGNYYQDDLGILVQEIVKLFSRDYIGYYRENVPFPEKN
ncbi:MAG: hypothetical protein KDD63_02935 [Bacteroidetes bacterium]|nr:hypothetical protein [Bacteroidota bacterium]MCB0842010.1 hypothetical protein [Bacteroidota bacterium]MCB0851173.1 hypothetical protein [Bacteroidota bacterium]